MISSRSSSTTTSAAAARLEHADVRRGRAGAPAPPSRRRPPPRTGRRARAGCARRRSSSGPCRRASRPRASARRRARPRRRSRRAGTCPAARTGGRDRVGDQRDPAGRAGPDEPDGLVGEVVAVDDHLHEDVRPGQRRAGDARVARAERPHRVEDVRHAPTRRGRSPRCASAAVAFVWPAETAMPRSRSRAISASAAPGSSGASVISVTRPRVEQPVEQRDVRVAPVLERVRARPLGREERALEVGAEHARAAARPRAGARAAPRRSSLSGRGDERRLVRRHAGEQQRLAGARVVLGRRGEEVDSAVAVHLHVDEAGDRDPAARGGREPDLERSGRRRPRRRRGRARRGRARPRRRASRRPARRAAHGAARRLEPVARRRRIDAREERDERDARVASGCRERGVDLRRPRLPLASTRFRRARARSLSLPGSDADHQAAVRPPQPDHRHRRDRVQDELLRGARLQPGRAGDRLRARGRPRPRGRRARRARSRGRT